MNLAQALIIAGYLCLVPTWCYASQPLQFSAIAGSLNTKVSAQVMQQVYDALGIKIEILYYPAGRSLLVADKGEVDGELFRLADTQNQWPNLTPIPIPINYMQGMVVTKDLELAVGGWQSLEPFIIGVRRGIHFSEMGTRGMNRIFVNTNDKLFELLSLGRVDLVVVTKSNWLLQTSQQNLEHNLKMLEPEVQSYPLFHYLHKKHMALAPKIEAVLRSMQTRGEIQQIRAKILAEFHNSTQ